MPIRAEDAATRIGHRVISTYPDNRGQVGTITAVRGGPNGPLTVVFVRFPRRSPKGCYPEHLDWADR